MSKGKRYEVIEEKSWHTVFIGTEQQVDAFIENPDHDETYIIREVKRPNEIQCDYSSSQC